jgi:hypothetical protein
MAERELAEAIGTYYHNPILCQCDNKLLHPLSDDGKNGSRCCTAAGPVRSGQGALT